MTFDCVYIGLSGSCILGTVELAFSYLCSRITVAQGTWIVLVKSIIYAMCNYVCIKNISLSEVCCRCEVRDIAKYDPSIRCSAKLVGYYMFPLVYPTRCIETGGQKIRFAVFIREELLM
jgi:hypothetical protein